MAQLDPEVTQMVFGGMGAGLGVAATSANKQLAQNQRRAAAEARSARAEARYQQARVEKQQKEQNKAESLADVAAAAINQRLEISRHFFSSSPVNVKNPKSGENNPNYRWMKNAGITYNKNTKEYDVNDASVAAYINKNRSMACYSEQAQVLYFQKLASSVGLDKNFFIKKANNSIDRVDWDKVKAATAIGARNNVKLKYATEHKKEGKKERAGNKIPIEDRVLYDADAVFWEEVKNLVSPITSVVNFELNYLIPVSPFIRSYKALKKKDEEEHSNPLIAKRRGNSFVYDVRIPDVKIGNVKFSGKEAQLIGAMFSDGVSTNRDFYTVENTLTDREKERAALATGEKNLQQINAEKDEARRHGGVRGDAAKVLDLLANNSNIDIAKGAYDWREIKRYDLKSIVNASDFNAPDKDTVSKDLAVIPISNAYANANVKAAFESEYANSEGVLEGLPTWSFTLDGDNIVAEEGGKHAIDPKSLSVTNITILPNGEVYTKVSTTLEDNKKHSFYVKVPSTLLGGFEGAIQQYAEAYYGMNDVNLEVSKNIGRGISPQKLLESKNPYVKGFLNESRIQEGIRAQGNAWDKDSAEAFQGKLSEGYYKSMELLYNTVLAPIIGVNYQPLKYYPYYTESQSEMNRNAQIQQYQEQGLLPTQEPETSGFDTGEIDYLMQQLDNTQDPDYGYSYGYNYGYDNNDYSNYYES